MGSRKNPLTLAAIALLLALAAHASPQGYDEGVAEYIAGRYPQAIAQFKYALSLEPAHQPSKERLARSYDEIFKRTGLYYTEALATWIDLYNTTADTDPKSETLPDAHKRIAELIMRGGDYDTALEYLNAYLNDYPSGPYLAEIKNEIGVANYYIDNYQEAVRAFDDALKIDPTLAAARFNQRSIFTRLSLFDQASANGRLGHYDRALEDLENLLTIAPRYAPAALKKIHYLSNLGRVDEAHAYGEKTIEAGVPLKYRFELLNLMGDLSHKKAADERALWYYLRALSIDPGYKPIIEKAQKLREAGSAPAAPLLKPGGKK